MRKLHFALTVALLLAFGAHAQSQFRQKIRHVEIHGDAWRLDDGSVISAFNCIADEQQPMLDGGSWPLKHRIAFADGGLPNPVLNSCATTLEAKNALDGGLQ
jgi:hypothetical protein